MNPLKGVKADSFKNNDLVSSYLKLPSCPAAFIAAATDTQLCLELKIHKCFLKKLLI